MPKSDHHRLVAILPIAVFLLPELCARTALAVITARFEQVPITATTDASGANLAGFQCWDLLIELSPGDDFTSFRLFSDPAGTFFQHALGQGQPNFGPPNPALIAQFPALAFDSYLRGPAGGVTVLGSTDGTNDLPPPGIFDEQRIAVAAGDLATNDQGGTFQLARLTLKAPYPCIIGRVFSVQDPDVGFMIDTCIPEPGMLGVAAIVGVFCLRSRKSSHGECRSRATD